MKKITLVVEDKHLGLVLKALADYVIDMEIVTYNSIEAQCAQEKPEGSQKLLEAPTEEILHVDEETELHLSQVTLDSLRKRFGADIDIVPADAEIEVLSDIPETVQEEIAAIVATPEITVAKKGFLERMSPEERREFSRRAACKRQRAEKGWTAKDLVLRHLQKNGASHLRVLKEYIEPYGFGGNTASSALHQLVTRGEVVRISEGFYQIPA